MLAAPRSNSPNGGLASLSRGVRRRDLLRGRDEDVRGEGGRTRACGATDALERARGTVTGRRTCVGAAGTARAGGSTGAADGRAGVGATTPGKGQREAGRCAERDDGEGPLGMASMQTPTSVATTANTTSSRAMRSRRALWRSQTSAISSCRFSHSSEGMAARGVAGASPAATAGVASRSYSGRASGCSSGIGDHSPCVSDASRRGCGRGHR